MRKIWLGLLVLVLLSPLGMLATGTAWGEWGLEELQELLGWVPAGLERFSQVNPWVLMPDYTIPGLSGSFLSEAAAYIASGLVGVGLCAGAVWLLALGKRD